MFRTDVLFLINNPSGNDFMLSEGTGRLNDTMDLSFRWLIHWYWLVAAQESVLVVQVRLLAKA